MQSATGTAGVCHEHLVCSPEVPIQRNIKYLWFSLRILGCGGGYARWNVEAPRYGGVKCNQRGLLESGNTREHGHRLNGHSETKCEHKQAILWVMQTNGLAPVRKCSATL